MREIINVEKTNQDLYYGIENVRNISLALPLNFSENPLDFHLKSLFFLGCILQKVIVSIFFPKLRMLS